MARLSLAGILANVFAAVLIIAPVETMVAIKRENNVGQRTVYNYVGTWANAVSWVGYAAPTRDWYVAGMNSVAMAAYLAYTCFYLRFAHGRARRIAKMAVVAELAWGLLMTLIYFAAFFGGRNEEIRVKFFGWLAAITTVLMYFAMIPNLIAVIRTHDMSQQGIVQLLSSVGTSSSWTAFGTETRDHFVLVSNAIGAVLTGVQTILWVGFWAFFLNAAPQQLPQNNAANQQLSQNNAAPQQLPQNNAANQQLSQNNAAPQQLPQNNAANQQLSQNNAAPQQLPQNNAANQQLSQNNAAPQQLPQNNAANQQLSQNNAAPQQLPQNNAANQQLSQNNAAPPPPPPQNVELQNIVAPPQVVELQNIVAA